MDFEDFRKEWEASSDVIICQTSGSTGMPESIPIPKIQMIRSAQRTCEFFDISNHSHLYSCVGAQYIGGKMMMVRSIVSGATFGWETPSNRPLAEYNGQRIDLLSIVPSQMVFLLDHPEILHHICSFLIGGAPIPTPIRKRIIESGIDAWESYGMTETSSHIALRKVKEDNEWFKTFPGITVEYHSENRLAINIPGWKKFLTNDIAEITSSHSFRILGRADNIINSGGKKISPEELEQVLSSEFTFPFFISSQADVKWGEAVVIVVAGADATDAEILLKCKEMLPSFKVPKAVLRLNKIPLTPNGKLKRIKF